MFFEFRLHRYGSVTQSEQAPYELRVFLDLSEYISFFTFPYGSCIFSDVLHSMRQ
jgi:hypothetical protein